MKKLLAMVLAIVVAIPMGVIGAFAANTPDVILKIVPDKTEITADGNDMEIIYTLSVEVKDSSVDIGSIDIRLFEPDSMTLGEGTVNEDLMYHSKFNPQGIFGKIEYAPKTKTLFAADTNKNRNLSENATLMTLKTTVDKDFRGKIELNTVKVEFAEPDGRTKLTHRTETTATTIQSQPQHEHHFGKKWKHDDTNHWHECSCGEKADVAAHTFTEKVTKEPTCTQKGEKTLICSVCGYKKTEEIPTINHNFSDKWEHDETKHWHQCTMCDEKADEAAHTYGDWTITKEATETTTGTREHTCSVCGYKETEIIPVKPHEHHFGTEWKKDANGHWHECACGEKADEAAHTYGDWTITKEATETETGSKERTCSVCGYKETAIIPVKPHEHHFGTEWKNDETGHWHECTCGEKSEVAVHTYGNWTTTKEATETETGSKERTCSVCGYKETAIIPVKPHEHHFSDEWKNDENGHWHECTCGEKADEAAHTFTEKVTKEPTCTEKGEKTLTCSVCGYKKTEEIPVLEHQFDDKWHGDETGHWHNCSVCGNKSTVYSHNYSDWKVTKKASETETGSKERVCSDCGYKETVSIPCLKVVKGADAEWKKDSNKDLSFTINHDVDEFYGIEIDGELVDEENYTVVAGSTIVTLKADYLSTLKIGKHTITFIYEDGECGTTFTIKNKRTPVDPEEPEKPDHHKPDNDHHADGDTYYTIRAKATEGGSISPKGSVSVKEGSSKTFTFKANAGFIISNVLVDGESNKEAVKDGEYTFKNVKDMHTIEVRFAEASKVNPSTGAFDDTNPTDHNAVSALGMLALVSLCGLAGVYFLKKAHKESR